jgi:hypothetical protein
VPSNLDRLPPNSLRKNKRKSQAKAHDSDPPRKRGRPRLSEQRRVEAENEIQKDASAEQAAAPEKITVMKEETPKMVTRRSTRQSAAATINTTSPVEPTLQELTPDESTMDERPKDTEFEEDETMVDVGDAIKRPRLHPPKHKRNLLHRLSPGQNGMLLSRLPLLALRTL